MMVAKIRNNAWLRAGLVIALAVGVVCLKPALRAQSEVGDLCPRSQGYWKKHLEAWPRPTLVLGNPSNPNHTYFQKELLTLLRSSTRGDASIMLARQLIAAKLNVFAGSNPEPIASPILQADTLLAKYPGKLPYKVAPKTAAGKAMTAVAQVLESYNEGQLPGSCASDNLPPLANAGPDQTVFVGALVQLNGSGSSDEDGDQLTYRWSFVSRPSGSQAALLDPSAVMPTFTADKPGRYEIRLVVNDGKVDSAPDTVVISTHNSKPVANAGADQTVFVGALVQLNGSGSSDVDGDSLTYRWQFLSRPEGSTAALQNATSPQPSFVPDKPGSYTVELVVNDGVLDSDPDTVVISTENSRPVANAGADQTVFVGALVQLDGSASTDADGDTVGYMWSFTSKPEESKATLSDPFIVNPTFSPDVAGLYVVQLIVSDGQLDSVPDTANITVQVVAPPPNRNPLALNDSALTAVDTQIVISVLGNDSDPDGDPISITAVAHGANGTVTHNGLTATYTPNAGFGGIDTFTYSISDGRGGSATATVTVTVDRPPQVDAGADQSIALPASVNLNGTVTDDGLPNPPGAATTTWSKVSGPGTVTFGDPSAAATTATFSQEGTYVLRLTASDGFLASSDDVQITVNADGGGGGLPPDPSTVAPPFDPSVASTIGKGTEFLYTGDNPIQTGVAPGTINPVRAAVIRGKVLDRNNNPLPGVTVTILNHPEFGQTLSRADGMFDMAVNGGGVLTINYSKPGLLPAQRQIEVPWQDFAMAPEVVLIALDSQVTVVSANSAEMQVHQSSVSADADGSRRATLLFPAGTTAQMVMPDGSTQPLTTLSVRATEYTVGPNGPRAMPGLLPPTSGYTYAVELSVDEAMAAGAAMVSFSQPIPTYVENFLNFPTGTTVPAGYYDKIKGAWVPAPNGRVIKITGVSGGLATVDTVGTGSLPPIVLADAERRQLAALYPVDTTLWRVPISHFTPWDCNWPWAPPLDATAPDQKDPETEKKLDEGLCESSGNSVIECQNQILGEAVAVVGTPYSLNYRTDRVPGWVAARNITVQASGASVPSSLRSIEVTVNVAGKSYHQILNPFPNQKVTFSWDGLDAYGRPVQGSQRYSGSIGYVYDLILYQSPAGFEQSFARITESNTPIGVRSGKITLYQIFAGRIDGQMDARGFGIGGWTLDVHSVYDTTGEVAYHGNGRRQRAQSVNEVIRNFAGFVIRLPSGLAVAPDGTVYYSEGSSFARVRRITPAGVNQVVAGTGVAGFSGDGGPATAAQLNSPAAIALGPDGSIYIADTNNQRIRRVSPNGIISTVAGNGSATFSGDSVLATQTALNNPTAVAVAADGTIYIADNGNRRIRSVGLDGIITTIAGTGVAGFSGDGGPATQARINTVFDIKVSFDGTLYFADQGLFGDGSRVRRIDPDGRIRTVAGTGVAGFSGDGGPATQAQLRSPRYIAVAPDNGLYIADQGNFRIRYVAADGTIRTVAGTGVSGYSGDGGPALQAQFAALGGLERGPDGSLYLADQRSFVNTLDGKIRRISPAMPGFSAGDVAVPSKDGSLFYQFNSFGKHLRTRHGLTGAILSEFGYDANGRLTQVIEKTGGTDNVTTIQRDASGRPTKIIGPYGHETVLTVDANGYLASIRNPANENVQMSYTGGGLMLSFTNPRGKTSQYSYDGLGRLIGAMSPLGGSEAISRSELTAGHEVMRTTPLGRTIKYRVESLPDGNRKLTTVFADNTQAQSTIEQNGTQTTVLPNGTVVATQMGADPRFGMQAPEAKAQTLKPPFGPPTNITASSETAFSFPSNPFDFGSLTETTAINGRTTTMTYQQSTRTAITASPVGRTSSLTIDALGRLVSGQVAGMNAANMTFDGRGRLATITRGTGLNARTLTFAYNPEGFVSSITDPLGRVAQFHYDNAGRVTSQVFPDGRTVKLSYDGAGNLTTLTPPDRPTYNFSYSDRDQLVEIAPPPVAGGGATSYTYNLDRQLTSVALPDGRSVALGYDSAGRRTSRTYLTGGVATGTDTFAYDSAGRLMNIAAASGINLQYTYDGASLLAIHWTGEVAGSVSLTYDNGMRLATQSVNGANTVSFTYDDDDLLVGAGALTITRSGENGLPTGTTLHSVSTEVSYNGFGEIDTYSATTSGAPTFKNSFTRDKLGRITQKVETIGGATNTYDYTYSLGGQLIEVKKDSAVTETYAYDNNGNRVSATVGGVPTTATYDDQDRLLTYGATTFTYNGAGDLQSKNNGGQVTSYQYDQLGNLLSVTLPNGTVISYVIDGRGRRLGKKVNNVLTKRFLYGDALRPVAELSGTGTLLNRFVYAEGHVPIYMIRDGVNYRFITDGIGSVRLVVNASTGAIAQRIDYDSFGNVLLDTNPGFQPFGFAGGLYDPDTGLVRMGARDYDASIGRWTAKDPIGFDGGDTNLYRYVSNDPVNKLDPTGQQSATELMAFLREAIANGVDKMTRLTREIKEEVTLGNLDRALELRRELDRSNDLLNEYRRELERLRNIDPSGRARYFQPLKRGFLRCLFLVGLGSELYSAHARAQESGLSTWEQYHEDRGKEAESYRDWINENIVQPIGGYFYGLMGGAFTR